MFDYFGFDRTDRYFHGSVKSVVIFNIGRFDSLGKKVRLSRFYNFLNRTDRTDRLLCPTDNFVYPRVIVKAHSSRNVHHVCRLSYVLFTPHPPLISIPVSTLFGFLMRVPIDSVTNSKKNLERSR